jgi:flagellar basal-body rod modification protein FlgD
MINAISGAPTDVVEQSIGGANGADQDMFLQLLVAQVRYQNPLEPMDNNEAMAQTAQFTMVEQMTKVAERQQELLAFQQATLASGLVGRTATGYDEETGATVSGVVSSVEFNRGDPQLIIDGTRIGVDSIISTSESSPEQSEADEANEDVDVM